MNKLCFDISLWAQFSHHIKQIMTIRLKFSPSQEEKTAAQSIPPTDPWNSRVILFTCTLTVVYLIKSRKILCSNQSASLSLRGARAALLAHLWAVSPTWGLFFERSSSLYFQAGCCCSSLPDKSGPLRYPLVFVLFVLCPSLSVFFTAACLEPSL